MSHEVVEEIERNPEEVSAIADHVARLADQVSQIASQAEAAGNELYSGWFGKAKNRFFLDYDPVPKDIRSLAGDLGFKAVQIKAISVIERVVKTVEDLF